LTTMTSCVPKQLPPPPPTTPLDKQKDTTSGIVGAARMTERGEETGRFDYKLDAGAGIGLSSAMMITSVLDNSEASKAGVIVGYRVTHLGGVTVDNLNQFKQALQTLKERNVGSCSIAFNTAKKIENADPPSISLVSLPSPQSSDHSLTGSDASTSPICIPQSSSRPKLVATGLTYEQFESFRKERRDAQSAKPVLLTLECHEDFPPDVHKGGPSVEDASALVTEEATTATPRELELLARCAALEADSIRLRDEVDRWRLLTMGLFNTLVLSPENCEYYKRVVREQLNKALADVNHQVHFVDCSFPSSPANAPDLKLNDRAASTTKWEVSWKPNWSVQVLCAGRKAGVGYTVLLKVSDFEISGPLQLNLSPDISEIRMQFLKPPVIRMELVSAVSVGPSIPTPLWRLLERAVRGACESWMARNLAAKELLLRLEKFRRKTTLTEADVELATKLAAEAALRC